MDSLLFSPNSWSQHDIIDLSKLKNNSVLCFYKKIAFNLTKLSVNVSFLDDSTRTQWENMGLNFLNCVDFNHHKFEELLISSLNCISTTPIYLHLLNHLVTDIVPLIAPEEVDVSFSDPNIDSIIFVSLPNKNEQHSIERFTEGLLHETFHLQLTLMEKKTSLVFENRLKNNVYSPWKGEGRNIQGLLHAIFVFSNIYFFWTKVSKENEAYCEFSKNRCEEIVENMNKAKHILNSDALTDEGILLCSNLFSNVLN